MRLRALLAVLTLGVVLSGCAPAPSVNRSGQADARQAERPMGPRRVVAAIMSEPPTFSQILNPANAAGSDALADLSNAGLGIVGSQGRVVAQLADAVPSTENGQWTLFPDGRMETVWRIRPGAVWHDGTPLTAGDAVFTVQVERDSELGIFRNANYELVESIEARDPATVVVHWRAPFVDADMLFTRRGFGQLLPRHLLERPLAEDKAGFLQLPYWSQEYVGLGPFKLREWVKGSHIMLDAHSDYVLGRPKIDEVEVRFFQDSNTLIAHLLSGTVQVTIGRGLSLEQALGLREQWRDGRVETSRANAIQIHPQFINPTPAVVGDVRFRRALLHAIDREQMVEVLEAGLSTVAHGWLDPDDPEYPRLETRLVKYDFDQRRATQLIDELGYTRGADGGFRDGAGQRLTVEIRTTESNDIQPKSIYPVADAWQRVGVNAEPQITPRQRAQDREYRATFPAFELIRGGSEPRAFRNVHSSEVRTPANLYAGGNYAGYANPELDALIDRYFTTIPRTERLPIIGEIVHHMTDRVVCLGLFYDVEATAISNRLRGAAARHKDSTQAWNAHEWELSAS